MACGGTPKGTPSASPAPAPSAVTAHRTNRGTPLVLSGDHAFVGSLWLPSGLLLAWSARELWQLDPARPEEARMLQFDAPIGDVAGNQQNDVVAVAMRDGPVSLVRDVTVLHTIAAVSRGARANVRMSPNGKLLLVRPGLFQRNESEHVNLYDVDTSALVRRVSIASVPTFDATSRFLADELAIYDLTGTVLWTVPDKERGSGTSADWLGSKLAVTGPKVMRLVDPITRRASTIDVACKVVDGPVAYATLGNNYVRACGNRFMVVEGETGKLHRIKMPVAKTSLFDQITARDGGYLVQSLLGDRQAVQIDMASGTARQVEAPARRGDAAEADRRHGESWVELQSGSIGVHRVADDSLVLQWGGPMANDPQFGHLAMMKIMHRVRAGALEVVGEPLAPLPGAAPFVHRFGAQAAPAPEVPAECQELSMSLGLPYTPLDLRRVRDRNDAICVCLDKGCDVRPYDSSMALLSASPTDLLYAKEHDETSTTLARVGKSTSTVKLEGDCSSATAAPDGRVFVLCRQVEDPSSAREGIVRQIVELASADLAVISRRTLVSDALALTLQSVGDELALTENMSVRVAQLFPVGQPGCTTCDKPVATVSTWPTFSLLERGGTLQIAGVAADAERAVVCVEAQRVRPWSACRP